MENKLNLPSFSFFKNHFYTDEKTGTVLPIEKSTKDA